MNAQTKIKAKQDEMKEVRDLTRFMTLRCMIVLALISFMAFGSYFTTQIIISKQQHDAVLMNISGRQRMLSQKLAFLSTQLIATQSASAQQDLRDRIRETVNLMAVLGRLGDLQADEFLLPKKQDYGENTDNRTASYAPSPVKSLSAQDHEAALMKDIQGDRALSAGADATLLPPKHVSAEAHQAYNAWQAFVPVADLVSPPLPGYKLEIPTRFAEPSGGGETGAEIKLSDAGRAKDNDQYND